MKRLSLFFIAIFLCIFFNANAQLDYLDSSFGGTGIVNNTMPFNSSSKTLALQSDGKILIAGQRTNKSLTLRRYFPNGIADGAFTYNANLYLQSLSFSPTSIAVSNTGKIVVAGYTPLTNNTSQIVVAKFQSNGNIDTTFGNNGYLLLAYGYTVEVNDMALQNNGKIVIGGFAKSGINADSDILLACFNNNGTLDTLFGTNGMVVQDFNNSNDVIRALTIRNNGKILVAGSQKLNSQSGIVQYFSNGILDSNFNDNASFTHDGFDQFTSGLTQITEFSTITDIDLDGLGNVLLTGTFTHKEVDIFNNTTFSYSMIVKSFSTLGYINNSTFGANGEAKIPAFTGRALTLLSNGNLVTVGKGINPNTSNSEVALIIFTPSGIATDTVFNSLNSSFNESPLNILAQPDDKVLLKLSYPVDKSMIARLTKCIPPSAVNINVTNVSCFGDANGAISITVNGGLPPYTFLWSNGDTTQNISNLSGGTYAVNVFDSVNCLSIFYATVVEPAPLVVSSSYVTDVNCFGDANGVVSINVSGGTQPYTYNWSNGGSTPTITFLSGGTYYVTVSDSENCILTDTFSVSEPTFALNITSIYALPASCATCADGSAQITVVGGTPPYAYAWSTSPVQITSSAINLLPGIYTVTVTDSNGCLVTDTVSIVTGMGLDDNTFANSVSVFPNPVTNFVTTKFLLEKNSPVAISVYDLRGRLLKTLYQNSNHKKGVFKQTFVLGDINNGIYMLLLTLGDKQYTQKLIVQ